MVQLFCLCPLMTYRLAAAHTPPPELLFPRHSSASWWSHRGGIWPGWCHSLLWCSHPHPTDHFCKTKSHLVELSSPWASLIVFPTLLSWINCKPRRTTQQGPCLLGCGWFLRAGVQLRVDETLRDPSHSRWLYAFQVLYCICCYLWFFPQAFTSFIFKEHQKVK